MNDSPPSDRPTRYELETRGQAIMDARWEKEYGAIDWEEEEGFIDGCPPGMPYDEWERWNGIPDRPDADLYRSGNSPRGTPAETEVAWAMGEASEAAYRSLRVDWALEDLEKGVTGKRRHDLVASLLLSTVKEDRAWRRYGFGSFGEMAENFGYSVTEASRYALAGRGIRVRPDLRLEYLRSRFSLESLANLGRVLTEPGFLAEPFERWLEWARTESTEKFRARVRKRMVERAVGQPVHDLVIPLPVAAIEKFDRSLTLLSEKEKRTVGDAEGLERLADYFLDREDPDRRRAGKRRVGDTTENRSRHIPEEVKRRVRARSGGFCEVPKCGRNRFLQFCHIDPHRRGGSRESTNIVEGCRDHHGQMDVLRTLQARVVVRDGVERVEFRRGTYTNGGLVFPAWPSGP